MNIDEDTLVIFCPAWGPTHLDYLKRLAVPSLMQPGNLPACGYKKIIVQGSTVGPIEPLEWILTDAFKSLPAKVYVFSSPDLPNATIGALRPTIRMCLTLQSRMLMLMPDTIIANGGIFNMRKYAQGKPVCVAAPHLRVNANSFVSECGNWFQSCQTITPKELVRFTLKHAHQSLSDSFCEKENGTLMGGISLTRITEQLVTIIHYLPTVYLAWFTESDAVFFDRADYFGDWDHHWNIQLNKEGRLRSFGSSELFFAAELTSVNLNRIHVNSGSKLEEHSNFGDVNMKCFVGQLAC